MNSAVLIAISAGGPPLLHKMIPVLCNEITLPVLIVQHMPAFIGPSLVETLRKRSAGSGYEIKLGEHGERLRGKTVYVAPGDWHMFLANGKDAGPRVALDQGAPENGCRPAADVLFRSAARILGPRCVGVVMTGMGQDGARGSAYVKSAGGAIIAQDRATCPVWGMPRVVEESGLADLVVPLEKIPKAIRRACMQQGIDSH